jgi:hypothetical protein
VELIVNAYPEAVFETFPERSHSLLLSGTSGRPYGRLGRPRAAIGMIPVGVRHVGAPALGLAASVGLEDMPGGSPLGQPANPHGPPGIWFSLLALPLPQVLHGDENRTRGLVLSTALGPR